MVFALFSSLLESGCSSFRGRRARSLATRSTRGTGLLGALLVVLFVAQASMLSLHGHATTCDPGPALDGSVALDASDSESGPIAFEGCAVCEMAQRIASEALSPALSLELPSAIEAIRAPIASKERAPVRADFARAAPRAPPSTPA